MEPSDQSIIMDTDDVLGMLDGLLKKWDAQWWDQFWSDEERKIPFAVNLPDENLKRYLETGEIKTGIALDVGCGNGRNSRYLANNGFDVDAIDFSIESIEIAKNFKSTNEVNYINASIFDIEQKIEAYDFIYDSGCLHHIKPHRRAQYLKRLFRFLKPDGYLGLVCFNEKGGAPLSDQEVYEENSMAGGLGYTEEKLKKVLLPFFEIVEFKEMNMGIEGETFGDPCLWSVLLKKIGHHGCHL